MDILLAVLDSCHVDRRRAVSFGLGQVVCRTSFWAGLAFDPHGGLAGFLASDLHGGLAGVAASREQRQD